MPNVYQPTNYINTAIALIFYLLMLAYLIYSFLGLFALLRFGRSKTLALMVTVLYLLISISLYAAASGNLTKIKF